MKIKIRKAKPGDEIDLANMIKEGLKRKNWNYTGSNKIPTKKKSKEWAKSFTQKSPDAYTFVAEDTEKKKVIGSTTFNFRKTGRLRHRADFGWGVHADYQGTGIATKLLKAALKFSKDKGFKKAEAEIAVLNIASVKLSRKLGFKIEGKKKKGLLLDNGKYADTIIVGKVLK